MMPKNRHILRLTLGTTTMVALSYGFAWPLYFLGPVFAVVFLSLPVWIGWNKAIPLLILLAIALLLGLTISEFFLKIPLLCIPVYGLLFFFIYFMENPPPMASMFMTIGITVVPMIALGNTMAAHIVAWSMLFNMGVGLVIAWLFHALFTPPAAVPPAGGGKAPPPAPLPLPRQERIRLALISTVVALTAVVIFFSLNMITYAFAMMQICLLVDSPSVSTSLTALKGKAVSCIIGGVVIVIVYELLVAVPTYPFLVLICCCTALLFSIKIYGGGSLAKAYLGGLITFLVLLGTSTMPEKTASINFYMRIAQILFAGLFAVVGLVLVEHLLRPWKAEGDHTQLADSR